jgi:hypothetical protein
MEFSGALLWTVGLCRRRRVLWVAERPWVLQEGGVYFVNVMSVFLHHSMCHQPRSTCVSWLMLREGYTYLTGIFFSSLCITSDVHGPRYRWEDDIKMDLKNVGLGEWTGSIWLRIWRGIRLLWMRKWIFGYHKMWGISWLAEDLLSFQKELCPMMLVS